MRASACGVSVPASRPRAAARKRVCFVIGSVLRQRGDSKCLRPAGMRAWTTPRRRSRHLHARPRNFPHCNMETPPGSADSAPAMAIRESIFRPMKDRKSGEKGKSVSVRVDLGGRRTNKKKEKYKHKHTKK